MMDLKMEVYTGELELLGILEQFDALIFEEKAFTAGSFSVECLMTNETLSLLRPDSILWIAGETAGIIEYIQKQADKNGPYMTVKGRLLSGILDRRILWGRYDLYDTVPAIMTALVDDCAVHPSRGNLETRKIPGLVCLDAPSIGDKIRIQRTGGTLLETLEELGTAYQIAFGIQFNPKIPRMEFWTRPGQDRSIHQDAHEPVFYSTELDDVLQSEYLYNSIDYRNVTLVGGEGEGPNRIYVTVGDGTSETPDNPMPSIPEDPGAYTVILKIDPDGSGTISGGGTFKGGEYVIITATPSIGYKFAYWQENGQSISTAQNYTFMINKNRNLTAVFSLLTYNIATSVDSSGGGAVSGAGSYQQGTSVTVTAIPNEHYQFVAWKENGMTVSTTANYTFTVSKSRALVATFSIISYSITTSIDPSGSGSASGAGTYNHGTDVTVKATPSTGYKFVAWKENGTTVSTNASYTFTMSGSRNLTAVFSIIAYNVTTSIDPSSSGSVSGAGTYNHGTSVTVKATPSTGYKFVAWKENGTTVSTNANYTFTVGKSRTLTAVFAVITYHITASVDPSGSGSVSGAGTYRHGTSVTVIATPSQDYQFVAWKEGGVIVSTSASYTFTVSQNKTLTAVFEVAPVEGLDWKPSTLPVSAWWRGIAYGNGKFVAIAESSAAAYSTDGINWTKTTLPSSSGSWHSVTYGNGKFVAVTTSGNAAYSTDGINWTATKFPSPGSCYSITYGNGKFVLITTSSSAAYSTDGINWTKTTLPSYGSWYSVTYGNGKFVAVRFYSSEAAYSTDGINWTKATLPSFEQWYSITYGNEKFVAVAGGPDGSYGTAVAAYSSDGVNWTAAKFPSTACWNSVVYGNKKFVTVAYTSKAAATNLSAYSMDGINWTTSKLPSNKMWSCVAYGNKKFVAIAFGEVKSNTAYQSNASAYSK